MTDREREEAISACRRHMAEVKDVEMKRLYWRAMASLINGRSKAAVQRQEEGMRGFY